MCKIHKQGASMFIHRNKDVIGRHRKAFHDGAVGGHGGQQTQLP